MLKTTPKVINAQKNRLQLFAKVGVISILLFLSYSFQAIFAKKHKDYEGKENVTCSNCYDNN